MSVYVVKVNIELEATTPEEAEDLFLSFMDEAPEGWYIAVEKVEELN